MTSFSSIAENRKLRNYYFAIQITGHLVLLVFGLLIYIFKNEFIFLGNIDYTVLAILIMFSINGLTFIGESITHKKFFFSINRYSWVVFFLFVVANSGGVNSQFLFLLIFPLLVAAVDLDEKAVSNVSKILVFCFALIIFLDPQNLTSAMLITKHTMRTVIFGVLTYYIYKLVHETLRQKFEKEEAKKRFIELIEIDKVKNDFLAVAEHQLRTPLSGAHWAIDTILREGNLNEANATLGKQIQEKIELSIGIINEMLKTVETTGQNLFINKQSVNLVAIVKRAISDLEFLRRQNEIILDFPETSAIMMSGDGKMLGSAITNIIDNAFRYSPKKKVSIRIKKDQEGKNVVLVVADNGIGITKDDMPYIFQRFYRGTNAVSIDPNESGIGLYTTKKVIDLHNGTITLESYENEGTKVTVTLPL